MKLAATRVRTHLSARIVIQDQNGVSHNVGHGRVQSFDADHDYGTQAVHGVGDYIPAEFVNLKFQGTITIDAFAIRTDDLVDLGLAALGLDILKTGLLDISLHEEGPSPYDPTSLSTAPLRVYRDVAITRYRESIREGQICGENATCFFRYAVKDPTITVSPSAGN